VKNIQRTAAFRLFRDSRYNKNVDVKRKHLKLHEIFDFTAKFSKGCLIDLCVCLLSINRFHYISFVALYVPLIARE